MTTWELSRFCCRYCMRKFEGWHPQSFIHWRYEHVYCFALAQFRWVALGINFNGWLCYADNTLQRPIVIDYQNLFIVVARSNKLEDALIPGSPWGPKWSSFTKGMSCPRVNKACSFEQQKEKSTMTCVDIWQHQRGHSRAFNARWSMQIWANIIDKSHMSWNIHCQISCQLR